MTAISKVYAAQFTGWQAKILGPKPGDDLLTVAHYFGRAGKQSLALAMAMRDAGVTGSQIVMACGAPQNNHRRGVLASGWFKRDNTVQPDAQGHTVYKITLTPKGEAKVAKLKAAADNAALTGDAPKPMKAGKGKRPANKVKAPKAVPASEPQVTGDAGNTAPQGEAPVSA